MFDPRHPSKINFSIPYFSEGLAAVNGLGYINGAGEVCIQYPLNLGRPFREGRTPVMAQPKGTFGYLDGSGAMAIGPCEWYCSGRSFDDGFALIRPSEASVGLIDSNGMWFVGPTSVDAGWRYCGGWIEKRTESSVVMKNLASGASFRLDGRYHIGRFSDGMCIATIPESVGQLSTFTGFSEDGQRVFSFTSDEDVYNVVGRFHEGLALFDGGTGADFGYLNKNGQIQIPGRYRYAYRFQEGLAPVSPYDTFIDYGWGFINPDGEYVIEPRNEFRGADLFSEGMAAICAWNTGTDDPPTGERHRSERWGYIDRRGEWTIPPVFSYAGPFREGFASVRFRYLKSLNDLYDDEGEFDESECSLGFISKNGTFIWPPKLKDRNILNLIVPSPSGPKGDVPPYLVVVPD